ncbi:signal peptidase I [Metapseudomonas otitidis]|uniref:signal peptidase I n=1 Tax=Metapseudomonas otitidis TaxID=319939 RepID=UPI003216CDB6
MKLLKLILSVCIPGVVYLFKGRPKLAVLTPITGLLIIALLTATRGITTAVGLLGCWLVLLMIHLASLLHGAYLPQLKKLSLTVWIAGWAALGTLHTLPPVIFHCFRTQALGMELYYIPSNSMSPTLYPGDIVIADKWQDPARLKEGDIVIFDHPEMHGINVIKRVAELASGSVYVLGDNKNNSLDSRTLGSIPLSAIQAKAITVISEKDHIPRSITR